jgi:hypothetical protein
MNLRFENNEKMKFVSIPECTIGLRSLIAALKRLSGVKITKLQTWLLTDDIWIDFSYKGYQFKIDTFCLDFDLMPENPECPAQIFQEIVEHLKNTSVRWWRRFI